MQTFFFTGYFVFALPSGKVIDWIGYKWTMVAGLLVMAAGALCFLPAARRHLSAVPGGAGNCGRGNDVSAGGGQSLCGRFRPGEDCIEPIESGAGLQLAGDHGCALRWQPVYFGHRSLGRHQLSRCPAALHGYA